MKGILFASALTAFALTFAPRADATGCTGPGDCTSGFCADGQCCDTACTGPCEACDVGGSEGTCKAVSGAPKHGTCPTGSDACGAASCDGSTRDKCAKLPDATVSCRASSCVDGVETVTATCDGKGACPAVVTKKCGAYACDSGKCRTSCRSTFDCATGYVCDDIDKTCVDANTCDGDHTLKPVGRPTADCTPYKCDKSKCLENCTATAQCVTGYVCNGKNCVPPDPVAEEDDSSCAMGFGSRSNGLLALLGLAVLGRAARRQRPT